MDNLCNIQDFLHTDNADNIEEGEQGENRVKISAHPLVPGDGVGAAGEHWTSILHSTERKKST